MTFTTDSWKSTRQKESPGLGRGWLQMDWGKVLRCLGVWRVRISNLFRQTHRLYWRGTTRPLIVMMWGGTLVHMASWVICIIYTFIADIYSFWKSPFQERPCLYQWNKFKPYSAGITTILACLQSWLVTQWKCLVLYEPSTTEGTPYCSATEVLQTSTEYILWMQYFYRETTC